MGRAEPCRGSCGWREPGKPMLIPSAGNLIKLEAAPDA